MDIFESSRPTYIENWPQMLVALSIPLVDIPLTIQQALALGSNIVELFEQFDCPPGQPIGDILQTLDHAVAQFPQGAFVRLGSRSPKDSYQGYTARYRATSGQEALAFLTDCSERVADDLLMCIFKEYPPHIFVRPWLDLATWGEFRCFMKGRRLVGISQYDYLKKEHFPQLEAVADAIPQVIGEFFKVFEPACHLDNVVFDLIMDPKALARGELKPRLLEINPFGIYTDPCLFSWKKPEEMDGSLRYITAEQAQEYADARAREMDAFFQKIKQTA